MYAKNIDCHQPQKRKYSNILRLFSIAKSIKKEEYINLRAFLLQVIAVSRIPHASTGHACMSLICNFASAFLRFTRLGSIEFRPVFATLPLSLSLSLSAFLPLPASFCMLLFFCWFSLSLLLFGKLIGLRALIAEVGVLAAKLFMAFSMTIFIASLPSAGFKNFSLHTLRRMSIWRRSRQSASEAALVIMMWNLCVAALSSPYRAPALSLCSVPFTLLCLTEFFLGTA